MGEGRAALPQISDFPILTTEKTRFGDTDSFGHINNAVVSTFLESGRSELLGSGGRDIEIDGCHYLLAGVEIEFRSELNWPGEVIIGSRVAKIGRSSIGFDQAVFQHGTCRVMSRSTCVQVNARLKSATELSPAAQTHFATLTSITGQ